MPSLFCLPCARKLAISGNKTGIHKMDKSKPSKPIARICKFISRLGKFAKKSKSSHPVIQVSCCIEQPPNNGVLLVSEPVAIAPPQKLLLIPKFQESFDNGESPIASPLTPRAVSYPPTPDYVKFSGNCYASQEASSVFFPAESSKSEIIEGRDWAIDYNDLEIGALYQETSTGSIHRGRWHGNVMVYKHHDENSVDLLMNDVENFSKIRHENVLLFMGASVEEMDKLSIVMLPPKQTESLHQLLSSPRRLNKLPHTLKWSIAHQIAQAVSYAHSKDVFVGPALHSGNVFLESKIKLSLLDFGFGSDVFCRNVPQNHLTSFVAPELFPHLEPNDPAEQTASLKINSNGPTDSYAFGSLLYEIFAEQKPFKGLKPAEIIARLGSGSVAQLLDRPDIPPTIRKIISKCWNLDPESRPTFAEILTTALQRKTFLLSRHCSQPDKLDTVGLALSRSFS